MVERLRESGARVEEVLELAKRIAAVLDRAAFEECWTVVCEEEYRRLTGLVRGDSED